MSGLKWTHKTTAKIAGQLRRLGIRVGARTVARLLDKLHFSLRVNCKKIAAGNRSSRDQQFRHITRLRRRFCRHGNPIISVDAKKRELVGNFKNSGQKWERVPTPVNDHDFRSLATGIALPFGIYDPQANRGSVFVGVSHETSAFAVTSISRWWGREGRLRYPNARHLLILADTGGSNSATRGAWKDHLQQHLCDRLGLTVTVAHYPTGASKYNPFERRLFSQISKNRAAEPLTDYHNPAFDPRDHHQHGAQSPRLPGHQGVSTQGQTVCAKVTRTADHATHNPPQVELHDHPFQWEIILAPFLNCFSWLLDSES